MWLLALLAPDALLEVPVLVEASVVSAVLAASEDSLAACEAIAAELTPLMSQTSLAEVAQQTLLLLEEQLLLCLAAAEAPAAMLRLLFLIAVQEAVAGLLLLQLQLRDKVKDLVLGSLVKVLTLASLVAAEGEAARLSELRQLGQEDERSGRSKGLVLLLAAAGSDIFAVLKGH